MLNDARDVEVSFIEGRSVVPLVFVARAVSGMVDDCTLGLLLVRD
jgi:hypothetical protein